MKPAGPRRTIAAVLTFLLPILAATTALDAGRQHLIEPGEDWENLDGTLSPGDEVVLMPGRHRPADFRNLRGEPDNPITIRGLHPHRSIIQAEQRGIRLVESKHVRIKSLTIEEPQIAGVVIDGMAPRLADRMNPRELDDPPLTDVTITDVRVHRTGPAGLRHAFLLRHVRSVRLESCIAHGWGGSAVEIQHGHDITVHDLTAVGERGFSQHQAVRVAAASQSVRIEHARFHGPVARGVVLGDPPDDLPAPLRFDDEPSDNDDAFGQLDDTSETSGADLFLETRDVRVERCIFVDVNRPVVVHRSRDAVIRQNTFLQPLTAVLTIDDGPPRAGDGPTRSVAFGRNLTVWTPDDLAAAVALGRVPHLNSVRIEENLWWTDAAADDLNEQEDDGGDENTSAAPGLPGPLPPGRHMPQVTDTDPELSDNLLPADDALHRFGAVIP